MNPSLSSDERPAPRKALLLSSRDRLLLHQLLHRDLRKCSTNALESCRRRGWISGFELQLTEHGRRIAEFSEAAPPDQELEFALGLTGPVLSHGQSV